ncbi:MAG: 6-phosphogluconolactonase [Candidatus Eremiobacteraeota bacterium]|nr:6-phosphogluconolactonase [Candidatus Eremiobacteraeota bacterium]
MASRSELHVYRDSRALARAVAELFVATGRMAAAERGAYHVALSGGSTPRAAYELLGQEPWRDELSWSDVFIYFGDERCVPPDDEQSNYRMAERSFLDSVGIPRANVHRIRGEIEPGHAANEYASLLRADLGSTPHFDLMLLGLGPDGHTASLFPGTPPDTGDDGLVRAVYAQSQMMWRITLTPKVINAARTVAFAVEGAEKAQILAAVYEGPVDPVKYPAQIVAPTSGRLMWLVDEVAAGMLKTRAR